MKNTIRDGKLKQASKECLNETLVLAAEGACWIYILCERALEPFCCTKCTNTPQTKAV